MSGNEKKARKRIALVSGGINDTYHSIIAGHFTKTINEKGHSVLWFMSFLNAYNGTTHDIGEMNIYNLINFKLIDAMVMMTLTMKDDKTTQKLIRLARENDIPVVSIDFIVDDAYNLTLGYEEALYDMVNHLIDVHNVRKFCFLSGYKGNFASKSREDIFLRVMNEKNISSDNYEIGYGSFWSEHAKLYVKEYYENHGEMPEAFVCANDSMAIGACEALEEMGFKVPDDVRITGIDGIEEAMTYTPAITTLKINTVEAGKIAAQRIIQILDGECPRTGNEIVDGELLYRESCGCVCDIPATFNNKIKHDLYSTLNYWRSQSNEVAQMVEASTGGFSFDDTMIKLSNLFQFVWSRVRYLCLCENFVTTINTLNDVYSSYDTYITQGYSENIAYTLEYSDGIKKDLQPFKTKEMLPNLGELLDEYLNFMFLPLHFHDRTIGYLAVEYTSTLHNFFIMNTYVTNISMVLENARIQCELRSFVNKLEDMYIRDSMTNLLNRRGFYQIAPKIYDKCIEDQKEFMIISIDLDGLKSTNDIYGHKEGDNAILTTANALLSVVFVDEIIARFGGDEFVVAGVNKYDGYAEEFVKKFQDYLKNYNADSGKPYMVQASCGIYKVIPDSEKSIDEFIRIADELMYMQKVDHKKRNFNVRSENR